MNDYVLRINGRDYQVEIREITPQQARVAVDGTEYTADLVAIGRARTPTVAAVRAMPQPAGAEAPRVAESAAPVPAGSHGNVRAPLPGLVLTVAVREGSVVKAGDTLLVLEAMKMENAVQAPHNGTVRKVFVKDGDSVGEGDPLIELLRPEMTTL